MTQRVEVGQVWESRDGARQVHVESVDGDGADPGSFVLLRGQRSSRIRQVVLLARYRLFKHADGAAVTR